MRSAIPNRVGKRPEHATTTDPSVASTPTRGGATAWIPASLGVLVLVTSLAVATMASFWLVPPYLGMMAVLLADYLPKSLVDRILRRGRVIATNPGAEEVGAKVATEPDASNESEAPASESDAAPSDEESVVPPEATTRSRKKSKPRSRKLKSVPTEPTPATWVQVAPGKFVRMEGPAAEPVPAPEVVNATEGEPNRSGEPTVPTEGDNAVENSFSSFDSPSIDARPSTDEATQEPEATLDEPTDPSEPFVVDAAESEVSEVVDSASGFETEPEPNQADTFEEEATEVAESSAWDHCEAEGYDDGSEYDEEPTGFETNAEMFAKADESGEVEDAGSAAAYDDEAFAHHAAEEEPDAEDEAPVAEFEEELLESEEAALHRNDEPDDSAPAEEDPDAVWDETAAEETEEILADVSVADAAAEIEDECEAEDSDEVDDAEGFLEDPSVEPAEADHDEEPTEEFASFEVIAEPSPEELELAELERLTAPAASDPVAELTEEDLERLTAPESPETEGRIDDETVPRRTSSAVGSSPAPVDADRVEPVVRVAFASARDRFRGRSSSRTGFRVTVNARTERNGGNPTRRPRAEGRASARKRLSLGRRTRSPPRSA